MTRKCIEQLDSQDLSLWNNLLHKMESLYSRLFVSELSRQYADAIEQIEKVDGNS